MNRSPKLRSIVIGQAGHLVRSSARLQAIIKSMAIRMFRFAFLTLSLAVLGGCATKEIKQTWEPSTLKPETISRVQSAVKVYERCADEQTRAHINDRDDSRAVTDRILEACEAKLSDAKRAFAAENVPDTLSERYLHSRRSRIAQQVVRVVMATQAVRSANPNGAP